MLVAGTVGAGQGRAQVRRPWPGGGQVRGWMEAPEQLPVQLAGSIVSWGQPHTRQVRGVGVLGMHTPTNTSNSASIDTLCKALRLLKAP